MRTRRFHPVLVAGLLSALVVAGGAPARAATSGTLSGEACGLYDPATGSLHVEITGHGFDPSWPTLGNAQTDAGEWPLGPATSTVEGNGDQTYDVVIPHATVNSGFWTIDHTKASEGSYVNGSFTACPGSPPVPGGGPVCTDTVFLAAMGSGQYYKSPTDLGPSPQLSYLVKAARSTARGKTTGVQVVNYPATSVDVLLAGLNDIQAPTVPLWLLSARVRLGANTSHYLAGEKQGLAAMWTQFNALRVSCPSTKVVPVGYSQGAMVVHEFLNELAATGNRAAQQAVVGAALLADPERLKWASPVEFSDAAPSAYGVCDLVEAAFVHCAAPDPLANVSPVFAARTASVCSYFDPVCDSSQLFGSWAALANKNARNSAFGLAKLIHESYAWTQGTRYAGTWLGRRIAQS